MNFLRSDDAPCATCGHCRMDKRTKHASGPPRGLRLLLPYPRDPPGAELFAEYRASPADRLTSRRAPPWRPHLRGPFTRGSHIARTLAGELAVAARAFERADAGAYPLIDDFGSISPSAANTIRRSSKSSFANCSHFCARWTSSTRVCGSVVFCASFKQRAAACRYPRISSCMHCPLCYLTHQPQRLWLVPKN
jgi:hypothetical protein